MILDTLERKALVVEIAKTNEEIREAQRLRHLVLSQEYGAYQAADEEPIDRDHFDPFCDPHRSGYGTGLGRRHIPYLDLDPGAECRTLPPLVNGCIRAGAYICGKPAWDQKFNSADLLMLLPLSRLESRYVRHFFGRSMIGHRIAA